ncbi:MAG: nicotinate-nucleotide adenylyltransferase [Chloroflexi bacterium]|nr:nicotinate-nucleotide adenylyltransferase [Chloroflexota bacterium]
MTTIGVFGGTFDPPHLGHLAAAQEALEAFGLDRVLFMPSERNPLKLNDQISPTEHRVAMTTLAIEGDPRFELSRADLGGGGPSYTVDLLERMHQELPAGADLVFITGMDVLHELHRWREPLRVLELARLIVVERPGQQTVSPESVDERLPGASRRISIVETPGVAVSSTELRRRAAEGRSLRYLVPDRVAAYIRAHGLYARSPESGVRSHEGADSLDGQRNEPGGEWPPGS